MREPTPRYVHFLPTVEATLRISVCGTALLPAITTHDPAEVTCPNCQQTLANAVERELRPVVRKSANPDYGFDDDDD